MIVRARAPLRISFAGGGTDVSPYFEKYGGMVLSTTIDRYAYCTVASSDNGYSLRSADLEIDEYYSDLGNIQYNGKLDLAKAVVKTVCGGNNHKLELSLLSEAPPGSGLGSSSALMVAIIKGVVDFLGVNSNSYSIAQLAYKLEREELSIKGGYQDQYASTFGGFNFIELNGKGTTVNPLRVRDEILRELLASLVLIDTGKSRLSSHILERQIDSYRKETVDVMEALAKIKEITLEAKSALLRGDLARFGELLGEEWSCKKLLDKNISNQEIEAIYKGSIANGALGGKVLGAGNGGHMLFFTDIRKRKALTKYLVSNGYEPVPFNFDVYGAVSWKVDKDGVMT
ncbi:MAG: GHMP kinase [Nitrososphaerota archaeon]|nr:GHMP kinase [Nitrososphaerota archaeon]